MKDSNKNISIHANFERVDQCKIIMLVNNVEYSFNKHVCNVLYGR